MDEKLQRCIAELRDLREKSAEGLYTDQEIAQRAIDAVQRELAETAYGR